MHLGRKRELLTGSHRTPAQATIEYTPGGQAYFRVAYQKHGPGWWHRGEAWANLLGQQIPGCPKPIFTKDDGQQVWGHGWVKSHTATEWAWVYWAFADGAANLEHVST